MKKLRRSLALVMAIVMLSGMFVFGAPVAVAEDLVYEPYADQASINEDYEDAVELFSMMKVIEGDAGTRNFRPDGNLQRREAAAIITRTLISAEQALILDNSRSAFGDVAAGQWFTGPIAFAQNRGLIAGIGNNMFAPEATLTKVQWVRILLSTLGWGRDKEFEGVGWESRVMETATNAALDLFGQHREGSRWPDFGSGQNRLTVPDINGHLPITREEAIALLYNAVLNVPKVQWTLLYGYNTVNPTPGLGGSSLGYIADDIGLELEEGAIERDRYGRPESITDVLWYRGAVIQEIPGDLPVRFAEERITPNMTGTELSLLIQGIPEVNRLEATKSINIFVNGYRQDADDLPDLPADTFFLRRSTAPDTLALLVSTDTDLSLTNNYDKVRDPWAALNAYLRGIGGGIAFGPSVAFEIYRHGDSEALDIVVIDTYLVQYKDRIVDDPRTPLVDESRITFNLFKGPGAFATEVSAVAFNEDNGDDGYETGDPDGILWKPIGLDDWDDFYDNTSRIGDYYLATPRSKILPIGGITPLEATYESNGLRNLLNEVFEASSTIVGIAGNSSVTRLAVGTSTLALGLDRPTVNRLDNTHNYTFYLDENDVIIGSVFTTAGRPSLTNVLLLNSTLGRGANTTDRPIVVPGDRAFAYADIITGGGVWRPSAYLPFSENGGTGSGVMLGSYVGPDDDTVRNLPASTTDPFGTPLDGYGIQDWYFFTTSGSGNDATYRLNQVPLRKTATDTDSNYVALSGSDISIVQGKLTIASSSSVLDAVATDRTILTVIAKNNSDQQVNFTRIGVDRFPVQPLPTTNAKALVLLEPGDNSRVAEILYISPTATVTMPETAYYAYLVDEPIRNHFTGTAQATFLVNETSPLRENLIINRTTSRSVTYGEVPSSFPGAGALSSRFYKLVQDEDGEWTATHLPYDTSGFDTVRRGFITGNATSTQFGIAHSYSGSPFATLTYADSRMQVVSAVDEANFGLGIGYLGDNAIIQNAVNRAIAVVMINDSGEKAAAAFVFNAWADGLPRLTS